MLAGDFLLVYWDCRLYDSIFSLAFCIGNSDCVKKKNLLFYCGGSDFLCIGGGARQLPE